MSLEAETSPVCFLDTETNDKGLNARLIQLAIRKRGGEVLVYETFGLPEGVRISPEAADVHKISSEMLEGKVVFEQSETREKVSRLLERFISVSHVATFDNQVLKNEGVSVIRSIDTYRVARHFIQSPSYGLEGLRTFFQIQMDVVAHDALGDVTLLEPIFEKLAELVKGRFQLQTDQEVLKKMMKLSSLPHQLEYVTFGKHRGKNFQQAVAEDPEYFRYILDENMKQDEAARDQDVVFTIQLHGIFPSTSWIRLRKRCKRWVRKTLEGIKKALL